MTGVDRLATDPPRLQRLGRLPATELIALIRGASIVVTNGGDTLLQSLACGRPSIAIPIAGDQAHRIERCVRAEIALSGTMDPRQIELLALELLQNVAAREALGHRVRHFGIRDGLETAIAAISALLPGDTTRSLATLS
jgi:UDP:flavonoid glycosyltransferase YjiC (YdhE family)